MAEKPREGRHETAQGVMGPAGEQHDSSTERTPAGIRQDPVTDPKTGMPVVTPPMGEGESSTPDVDPATLDDENFEDLDADPGSMRVIPLPRKEDGSINLLGMDVEVMEETTDYGDVVKCRVQGDPKDISRLAMRSRNYFNRENATHLHASGDITPN